MKFDIFNWQEVNINEDYEAPQGLLHVMCDQVAAVYVEAQGYEVLAGIGTEVKITTAQALTVRVRAPKGARAFIETPMAHHHRAAGEIYTNLDKKPTESIAVQEVRRALREFKFEQSQIARKMRADAEEFKRQADAINRSRTTPASKPETAPETAPEPAPEPEQQPAE